MKLPVNFGDELKHAKITYPKTLPVTNNGEFVGEAVIQSDGMAELNIVNEQQISDIKNILELGVGGIITSREGDLITGFNLKEVSIQFKRMIQETQKPQLNIPVISTSLFIGQTVWYKSLSSKKGDDVSLKETKILSVGKKYFETEERYLGRFFKDSLKHDAGQYSSRYQIYLSKEQYENEVEANQIYSELRNIFSSYGRTNMELSKLRAILSIVRS